MPQPPLATLIRKRYSRRTVLRGSVLASLASFIAPVFGWARTLRRDVSAMHIAGSSLTFSEIAKSNAPTHRIAEGYDVTILARWGDPLAKDAPPFDPHHPTAEAQAQQFGFNNDFTAFMPLPLGSNHSGRGLLCVNHEYTDPAMMFPHTLAQTATRERVDVEMAAQGLSIVEIARNETGDWSIVRDSAYNRRFTATSPMALRGPAAGHARLQTPGDPDGATVLGTLANCAGGVTPWGTVLSCEENINDYFSVPATPGAPEARNHAVMGIGRSKYGHLWHRFYERFNGSKNPNESNRFGWVVEYDPYDPASTPVKRTALGRFKHETATTALTADGRLAVYSGDDEKFQYLYRFVSEDAVNPHNRDANRDLLDRGTLFAARFEEDGTLRWLPLVFGDGALTPEHDFHSQADVLIETRRAASLAGATPMDRPEGIAVSPVTGKIYVALSKNPDRDLARLNIANPRPRNLYGHILELTPPAQNNARDHGADTYLWSLFLEGGNPQKSKDNAYYRGTVSTEGWLANPDNLTCDPRGRLWIATDGQDDSIGYCDGLYAADAAGDGAPRLFFSGPQGCEIAGPSFTPDGTTLFLSIQHPAEGSRFDRPSSRWPDFDDATPPRPSVIAITRRGGGPIGG